MTNSIRIVDFDPAYQTQAAELINTGLGEHFGFVDESMNPDLFDIETYYGEGDFLLALDGDRVAGTGSLMPVNGEVGRIARMHTAASYRRSGVASRVLGTLEARALARGFTSVVLETNLGWDDANAFYSRHGYLEATRNEVEIHYLKSLNPKTL